jgi:RNA polymerase sigma-70 factor, ECF subfamily
VIGDTDSSGNARAAAPDEVLVRATLDGDATAFTLLVRRYLRKAMAVAMEFARTREDAEDMVQDTFRRTFESLDSFDPARRFSPWLFTILRNTARNALKKRRIREHGEIPHAHAASGPGPWEDTRRAELRRRIAQAMESLTPMQRTCFRLCLVEGLSNAEAADATGLAESTVRVHVFNARRALQTLLADWRDEVRNP